MNKSLKDQIEELQWAVYSAHQEPHSSTSVIEVSTDKLIQLFQDWALECVGEKVDCGCGRHRSIDAVYRCTDPEIRSENQTKELIRDRILNSLKTDPVETIDEEKR